MATVTFRLLEGSAAKNPYWFKKAIQIRLHDMGLQTWSSAVWENNNCVTYRMFKDNPMVDPYLNVLNDREKIMLTRFRCRNSFMSASRNIYNMCTAKECKLCCSGELGDEFHYLFICPMFSDARKKLLHKHYYLSPNSIKMKALFQSRKRRTLIGLVRLIENIVNVVS